MARRDPHLQPVARPRTLDTYGHRRAILEALRRALPDVRGTVLDVGSGHMPYRELLLSPPSRAARYLGLDLEVNLYRRPDLTWDGTTIPLPDGAVDTAVATETFEHCPAPEDVMREIWRVLRPGGLLVFTVPFLWPLHDVPFDEYRFTPFSLRRHLEAAGFGRVEIRALGGWNASLAQAIGLWVRRRPMPRPVRSLLSILLWPVVWLLRATDRVPSDFTRSVLCTGFAGRAEKPA
jgi:SAM-dependent methyltransferase